MRLTLSRLLMVCCLCAVAISSRAQSSLIIPKEINLLPDTASNRLLIASLNGLLSQKGGPARENKYVLKANLPETAALLDEMKDAEQNAVLKDAHFYKPYLTNVVKQGDGDLLVQLAYLNNNMLHASFRLMAKKQEDGFCFYSPLQKQTVGWKTRKEGNITAHYPDSLNIADLKAYRKTLDFYNSKLQAPAWPTEVYYCNDLPQALQILGIDYKADYNGLKSGNLSTHENHTDLYVNGSKGNIPRIDPHDLFHERLRSVLKPEVINRPVDEGCAYLYGGSWGYSWAEIKSRFKKWLDANPNPDWLNYYLTVANFEAGQKPLKVNYVLNALIAQKLEKEKGFPAVLELLSCGKREQGDANYFAALEKLTGITKADFNVRMSALVKKDLK